MRVRVKYFDIAKGIGILCIIAGHMGNAAINNFVFTFHVPIFFLISGYFLKNNTSLKEFAAKKYKQLIYPYIITCICIIVGVTLSNIIRTRSLEYLVEDVKTWFIASVYGSGSIEYSTPFYMGQIGAVWFLTALFTALMIVRYFIDYEYGWAGVILLAYVGYKTGTMVWMPLSVQAGMTAAVFVYLGWIFNKHKVFERPISAVWLGSATVVWLFGILFCGRFYIVRNYFGNGLFDILAAAAGSYVVIEVCKVIERKTKNLARVLEFYGRNSLLILCMHAVELHIIDWSWVWQSGERLQLQTYQVIWIIFILKVLLFTVGIYVIRFLKERYNVLKKWAKEKYESSKKHETKMLIMDSAVENRIEYMDMAKYHRHYGDDTWPCSDTRVFAYDYFFLSHAVIHNYKWIFYQEL